jgi:hypothetical protein
MYEIRYVTATLRLVTHIGSLVGADLVLRVRVPVCSNVRLADARG